MCCHCVLHKGAWAHSHHTPAHVGSTQICPPNILALKYQWAQKVKQFNIIGDPVFPRWDVTEQRQCLVSTRQRYKIIERGGRDNRDWRLSGQGQWSGALGRCVLLQACQQGKETDHEAVRSDPYIGYWFRGLWLVRIPRERLGNFDGDSQGALINSKEKRLIPSHKRSRVTLSPTVWYQASFSRRAESGVEHSSLPGVGWWWWDGGCRVAC